MNDTIRRRTLLPLLTLVTIAVFAGHSKNVHAECGGSQDCIAVSVDANVAPAHGTPLVSDPLTFGQIAVGSSSAPLTIYVGAVTGPAGTMATLDPPVLSGRDAGEFALVGGTCTFGTPSLLHDGPTCTIEVQFSPTSEGAKEAQVRISSGTGVRGRTRTIPLAGGRPNPTGDPLIETVARAQIEAAKRYTRTQFSHHQHRFATLRAAPAAAAPETALAEIARDAAQHRQIDLDGVMRAASSDGATVGHPGFWAAGDLRFGSRDESGERPVRFTSDGITLGIDQRFSEQLLAGLSAGVASDESFIDDEGSRTNLDAQSLSAYLSYRFENAIHLDGLVGFGTLDVETRRHLPATGRIARGSRDGDVVFTAVTASRTYDVGTVSLSPYGSLHVSDTTLDGYTEDAAPGEALMYDEEQLQATQFSFGLFASARQETSGGSAMPHLRVQYSIRDEGSRDVDAAFVDSPGVDYTLSPSADDEGEFVLGIGNDLRYPSGLHLGWAYQHSEGGEDAAAISFWVTQELEPEKVSTYTPAWSPIANPIKVEAGVNYASNLNRSRSSDEALSDRFVEVTIGQATDFNVGENGLINVSGFIKLVEHREHQGLDRATGGARGEYLYRTSPHFTAPTFGAYLRLAVDEYESDLRSGNRQVLGASYGQQLTDAMHLRVELEQRAREADDAVFDLDETALRAGLDFDLGNEQLIFTGLEFRQGDTVTASSDANFYDAISGAEATDDAWFDRVFDVVRYEATTTIFSLGYNLALGPQDSVDIAWRRATSEPDDLPPGGSYTGSSKYDDDQVSLFYISRF